MGDEVTAKRFRQIDFQVFTQRFKDEMQCLKQYFEAGRFSPRRDVIGMELEAWLMDDQGLPKPENEAFLAVVNSPQVVAELSRFNFELNVAPQSLVGLGPRKLIDELQATWQQCQDAAASMQLRTLLIGSLPTLVDGDLRLENLSPLQRYAALNEQVLRLRRGKPIALEIVGAEDRLQQVHHDVMLEAASTSLQVHLQVPFAESVRYYNASLIASAITVGVAANSPLLFGHLLWEETRIPVFEQAVDTGATGRRVSFGTGYAQQSLLEVFQENETQYPFVLPVELDQPMEKLAHVRLHNGTIWRWNRPLIGFDDDGRPHLRIEHRVMAAGPSLPDVFANVVFALGVIDWYANWVDKPEQMLPFRSARENFYQAARLGLQAEFQPPYGHSRRLWQYVLDEAIGGARHALSQRGVDTAIIDEALEIISQRTSSQKTGAAWQRSFFKQHQLDTSLLTRTYAELQASGKPVHTWPS